MGRNRTRFAGIVCLLAAIAVAAVAALHVLPPQGPRYTYVNFIPVNDTAPYPRGSVRLCWEGGGLSGCQVNDGYYAVGFRAPCGTLLHLTAERLDGSNVTKSGNYTVPCSSDRPVGSRVG